MLGYDLLEILSDARSGSDPDLVSGFYWIYSPFHDPVSLLMCLV